jgi:putative ABC transport system permease protein
LLIQSLANLQRVNLGFDSGKLMTFQLAPPAARYPPLTKAPQLYRTLLDGLRSIPGARAAGASSGLPFGNGFYTKSPFVPVGQSVLEPGTSIAIDWRVVSPGFFNMMQIPLLRGRDFTDADATAAQPVMIVSEATAKKFWGNEDPLGRALKRAAAPGDFKVVGVVADVRDTALNQESPSLYYPLGQRITPSMDLAVRTSGPPEAILPAIREKVHELDPQLALSNVRTMEDWISTSAAQPRLNAILLGGFAVMALIIAAIGIYGVIAYSVTQRTQEIGLRIALGAQASGVLRLIVGEGMRVALLGIAIGLAGGFALGRAVSSLVYGVTVRDPLTFGGVAAVLAIVALAATIVPALRASRVDPIVALRCD